MLRITLESDGARRLEWIEGGGSSLLSLSWRESGRRREASSGGPSAEPAAGSAAQSLLRVPGWLEIIGRSRS